MIAAWEWLKKWGWLLLLGVGATIGAILSTVLRRDPDAPHGQIPTDPKRADQERQADEAKAASDKMYDDQIAALKLRALAERDRRERAQKARQKEIERRSKEASAEELRKEILDGAKEILEGGEKNDQH